MSAMRPDDPTGDLARLPRRDLLRALAIACRGAALAFREGAPAGVDPTLVERAVLAVERSLACDAALEGAAVEEELDHLRTAVERDALGLPEQAEAAFYAALDFLRLARGADVDPERVLFQAFDSQAEPGKTFERHVTMVWWAACTLLDLELPAAPRVTAEIEALRVALQHAADEAAALEPAMDRGLEAAPPFDAGELRARHDALVEAIRRDEPAALDAYVGVHLGLVAREREHAIARLPATAGVLSQLAADDARWRKLAAGQIGWFSSSARAWASKRV